MADTQKKVIVRKTDGSVAWGYLAASSIVEHGSVALMGVDGKVKSILFSEIELIYYVRDFNLNDDVDPERLGRRTFLGRPRGDGLWVRILFHNESVLEGLMPIDVGFIHSAVADQGIFLTPPDGRGNVLRVFAPRHSIQSLNGLGWVSAPSRRAAAKQTAAADQSLLFEDEE